MSRMQGWIIVGTLAFIALLLTMIVAKTYPRTTNEMISALAPKKPISRRDDTAVIDVDPGYAVELEDDMDAMSDCVENPGAAGEVDCHSPGGILSARPPSPPLEPPASQIGVSRPHD